MKPDSHPASLKQRLLAIALCTTSGCGTIGLFYAVPLLARLNQPQQPEAISSPVAPAPESRVALRAAPMGVPRSEHRLPR